MTTVEEQAEQILLLYYLTGMSIVDAAYAVVVNFDTADFEQTAALTIQIEHAKKILDDEWIRAHSQPTQQGDQDA